MSIESRILAKFSEALEVRKGSDLYEDMYVYLDGRWVYLDTIEDGSVTGAVADHGPCGRYEDVTFKIDPEALYVAVRSGAQVKFDNGSPAGTPWPTADIIYVEEAYVGATTEEYDTVRVSGLFVWRYDTEEAMEYYVPYMAAEQRLPSTLSLMEDVDVIVSWRRVDVADILKAVAK